MALLSLRCRIEQIADWHPRLFLEPHIVACLSVMSEYSAPPDAFEVECGNIASTWLGDASRFTLEVSCGRRLPSEQRACERLCSASHWWRWRQQHSGSCWRITLSAWDNWTPLP